MLNIFHLNEMKSPLNWQVSFPPSSTSAAQLVFSDALRNLSSSDVIPIALSAVNVRRKVQSYFKNVLTLNKNLSKNHVQIPVTQRRETGCPSRKDAAKSDNALRQRKKCAMAFNAFASACCFIPLHFRLCVSTIPNSSSVKKIYVRLRRVSRRLEGYGEVSRRIPVKTGEGTSGVDPSEFFPRSQYN